MIRPSSFHFRKGKTMPHGHPAHKLTGRRRFLGVSHVKLTDVFKSLRLQRLRRGVPRRSSLTQSRYLPPTLTDQVAPAQLPLPDVFVSSPFRYRSYAVSLSVLNEEDFSSGMNTSTSSLDPAVQCAHRVPSRLTFPTSPSMFHLRSSSTEDYRVDLLEQHLRQLNLDASPDHFAVRGSSSSYDIPSEAYLGLPLPRTMIPATSSCRALSDKDSKKPILSPRDQNVLPMIFITSVDAKHAKPLPPSSKRPSRTPLSPYNAPNRAANLLPTESKLKTLPDDPFTTQPHDSSYPLDYDLTFRIPSFPSGYLTPSNCDPETPTPRYCGHFGDCSGDMWEVLHPPLVAGSFTLPPFALPPLSKGLFDDMFTTLRH